MTIEERVAHLLEHGRGCPRAVTLRGPEAIEAWLEYEELALEAAEAEAEVLAETEAEDTAEAAREDAEEATDDLADPAAEVGIVSSILERLETLEGGVDRLAVAWATEAEDGPPQDGPTLAAVVAAFPSVMERLEALERAVDALAVSGPPEDAVGDVAAGGEPTPTVTPGKPKKDAKK